MFQFLGWLIIGALIGWLASKIMHGKGGLLRNIILGVAGRRVQKGILFLCTLFEKMTIHTLWR